MGVTAVNQRHRIRAQIRGFQDLAAAALHRFVFKILAHPEKEHYAHRLRVFPDGKSAQGSNAHKEVFVKNMAFRQIFPGSDQYFQSKQQIGSNAGQQAQPDAEYPRLQQIQRQTQGKQHPTQHKRTALLPVIMVVFMVMVMVVFVVMVMVVFVVMAMPAAAGIFVGMRRLSGDPHLRFNAAYDLLQLRQQTVGVFGGDPQLLCGEGDSSLHLGQRVDLSFHFCRTVGAAQILQGIAFGNHIRPSLIQFYI